MSIENKGPETGTPDDWLADPNLCFEAEDALGDDALIQARIDFVEKMDARGYRNVQRPEDIPDFARTKPQ